MSRRSSCCGAVTVSTDSGTVTGPDEISVWGGKSEASGDVLRRITMGMRGLGVTLRLLSDCWRDVVVTSEVDVEVPAVGVETFSGEPVMGSGSQRAAEKETRNTTIAPTILCDDRAWRHRVSRALSFATWTTGGRPGFRINPTHPSPPFTKQDLVARSSQAAKICPYRSS